MDKMFNYEGKDSQPRGPTIDDMAAMALIEAVNERVDQEKANNGGPIHGAYSDDVFEVAKIVGANVFNTIAMAGFTQISAVQLHSALGTMFALGYMVAEAERQNDPLARLLAQPMTEEPK